MRHLFHNLSGLAHITILRTPALKYNPNGPKLNFQSLFRTNPNAKRLTVPTRRKTYGHTGDLINLTGDLISKNGNLNRVKAFPVHAMKVYVWRRGTAPFLPNYNTKQFVASFTNDVTLHKSFKRMSTVQRTVHKKGISTKPTHWTSFNETPTTVLLGHDITAHRLRNS
jgi:hypothetical protein